MSGRFSTVIFVPHARAKFRKLKVSHTLLGAGLFLLSSSLILSGYFSFQYFTSLSQSHELHRLKKENRELQSSNEQFSKSVEDLRGQLRFVEERTRKLAIVAGINPQEIQTPGGVGGLVSDSTIGSPHQDEIDRMTFRSRRLTSDLGILESRLQERERLWSSTPSIAPVRGLLTDSYGGRYDPFTGRPSTHSGIDIATPQGRPIIAPADGVVAKAEWASGYGKVVFLSHGYGYSSRYGHLSKINVKPGQKVKRGDVIGLVGSTGRSTGPHLHYEVRLNGQPMNPLEFILDAF
jgi:murein DD-endopeptidase MepM/ murein hydrolase activator NlpD